MTLQGEGKRNETLDVHAEGTSANHAPSHEEIRLQAFEIYLDRGGVRGNELDDWLRAERELQRAATPKAKGFSIKETTQ